jgi:hypothetical protein
MAPGATYTVDLESEEFDAYVRVEDAKGKKLAEDDDSGGFLNSRLLFRPKEAGEYRIVVTTCDARQTGTYRLTVRRAEDPAK